MGPEQTPHPGADWSDALDRYYAGECRAEERAAVEAYLAHRPRIARFFHVFRQVLDDASGGEVEAVAGLHRVKRISEQPTASSPRRRRSSIRSGGWPRHTGLQQRWHVLGVTIAALAAIVVVTVAGWTVGARHVTPWMARPPVTYTTGNGQRATITLSDGSTVALGVASRLDVPADYAAGHHTVSLVGEALFTVAPHAGAPFSVIAGGTTAMVLGTSFLVRHYAQDTTTTVAVREGKVAVRSAARSREGQVVMRSIVLTAARQVTVGPTGVGAVRLVNPDQFSFATGLLTLDNVRFPQAILELDRWYDTDIRLGDPRLAAQAVTGEFAEGSLGDLTDILSETFNVRVVRNMRVLTLYPK